MQFLRRHHHLSHSRTHGSYRCGIVLSSQPTNQPTYISIYLSRMNCFIDCLPSMSIYCFYVAYMSISFVHPLYLSIISIYLSYLYISYVSIIYIYHIHCFTRFFTRRIFIHAFIHSFIDPFIHPLIHSFIDPFIHSLIHSCIHPFIHSFIHSLTHSFIHTGVLPSQEVLPEQLPRLLSHVRRHLPVFSTRTQCDGSFLAIG